MNSFGTIIRQARKEKRYSQQELASVLGIDKSYLSKLENNKADCFPSLRLIEKIALFMGEDKDILARKAGLIPEEDWQIFIDLYRLYGKSFSNLIKKLHEDESFARRVIDLSKLKN